MKYTVSNSFSEIKVSEYIANYRDVDKFMAYCMECDKYSKCWACAPFDFDTTEYISQYERLYIIGTKITPSKELMAACTNSSDSRKVGEELIRRVREDLDKQLLGVERKYENCIASFAGSCHLCYEEGCTRIENKACRYPNKIRYSLEALGFDIGKTTENLLNIEMQWSTDGSLPQYLTLVSGLFSNTEIKELF